MVFALGSIGKRLLIYAYDQQNNIYNILESLPPEPILPWYNPMADIFVGRDDIPRVPLVRFSLYMASLLECYKSRMLEVPKQLN